MKFLRSLVVGIALALASSSAALAQCGTTAPANKFCGNDTGSSALATWKSIPPGALSAVAGGTVLGNPTGASAVPIATRSPVLGVPGSAAGMLGIAGSTSGTAYLQAQAAAGAGVSLLPTSDGTLVSTASSPLAINPVTGQISITGLAGGVLAGSGPAFTIAPVLGVPGSSQGSLGFAGATSGTVTVRAQAAAGTATLTLPNTTGTLAAGATSPLVLNATTGGLSCPTCVTSSGGGAISGTAPISVSGAGVVSINAPYGSLTASNGGIVYSGATNLAILAGTATAGQMLQSGASAAPAWSTATWPATTTASQLLYSSSANVVSGLATANNGVLVTNGTGVPSISSTLPSGIAATNMVLTTPNLGTPSAAVLTNATGLPISTGVSGLGTGVATFLATPTSANLAAAVTNETGSGALVFGTGPTLSNPVVSGASPAATGALGFSGILLNWFDGTVIRTATCIDCTQTLTNKTMSGASNTFSSIALSSLASQAANTLVGNFTAGAASPTASTIGALTQKVVPGASDLVLIQDQSASGALKYATVSSIGASSGVSSLNGQTGALVGYFPPQGRVTLTSGVPVLTTATTGNTIVYYTPYVGSMVVLYDGANMVPTSFTELSQATTDTTKSPAATVANSNYDIFVWNDGGTLRATRGPAWTTSTSRGTGAGTSELTRVNGLLLNANAITNGPAAQRGTYVGTVRTRAADGTIDWNPGGSASGGTAAQLMVWNAYNRVQVSALVTDSGASYAYSAATIRQSRASTGNQINMVVGLSEESQAVSYMARGTTAAASNAAMGWTIGLDSASVAAWANTVIASTSGGATAYGGTNAGTTTFGIGYHFVAALEFSDGTNSSTYDSSSNNVLGMTTRM